LATYTRAGTGSNGTCTAASGESSGAPAALDEDEPDKDEPELADDAPAEDADGEGRTSSVPVQALATAPATRAEAAQL